MMRGIHGMIAAAGASSFSYTDIPDQLIRINSLEGSLSFSGGVLTGVTDVSGQGETVTVASSPAYTAANAALNNAPSWTGGLVVAPNVVIPNIAFLACVVHMFTGTTQLILDGDDATDRLTIFRSATGVLSSTGSAGIATGDTTYAGKYALLPYDGATLVNWNGAVGGTLTNAVGGTGLTFASNYLGSGDTGAAFYLLSSSVPSAGLRAALTAQLIADFIP